MFVLVSPAEAFLGIMPIVWVGPRALLLCVCGPRRVRRRRDLDEAMGALARDSDRAGRAAA